MIARGCVIGGDWITDLSTRLIGSGRVRIVGRATGVDITTNLVNRWPLTSNANDVVGALNLTNNGSVTFSSDGALFDGSRQYLSGTKTRPTPGTVSLWIRPSVYAGNRCFCGWGINSSPYSFTGVMAQSPIIVAYYKSSTPYDLSGKTYNSSDFPSSSYTHITFKWNSSTLKTYVGGVKLTGDVSAGSNDATSFAIGAFGAYNGSRFAGYIKDARIYSVELSDAQIATLVANGPNP